MKRAALTFGLLLAGAALAKPGYMSNLGLGITSPLVTLGGFPPPVIQSRNANSGINLGAGATVTTTVASVSTSDVLVALVTHARDSNGTNGGVTSPNLSWTSRVSRYGGANRGEATIYTAVSAGTLANEVVTLTNSGGTVASMALTVVRISGANTSALSTTGTNSQASTTAATVSVTATGPNSYLLGCAQGWTAGTTGTAGANTAETSDQPDTTNGNSNYAAESSAAGGSGSRSLNWTWAAATVTDSAAIEIKGP